MNEQKNKFLKSVDPDLEAIITQREKEQKGYYVSFEKSAILRNSWPI